MRSTGRTITVDTPNERRQILVYLSWPLFILKLLGLLPIFTTQTSYEIGRPSRRAMLLNRATLLTKASLNIMHIFTLLSPVMLQLLFIRSHTDGITNMLDIAFCILSDVTITWTCARNADKAIIIINSILKVDKLLQKYPGAPAERSHATMNQFTVYLIWMFGFLCLTVVASIKQTLANFSFYICAHTFSYQLENATSFAFVVLISALLHQLAERFRFVNQLIAQYNCRFLSARVRSRNALTQDEENLRRFAESSSIIYSLHVDLLDIYKMINNYAGLGLLAFFLYACTGLLTCTYICSIYDWVRNEDLYHVLWILLWIPYFAAGLILLTTNCAKATREANNTSQILARVYGKGKEYQNIIDKFLSKSIKQDVHFTAYDFFVIDNTTLFKISSALVTYLVILIQFKQLEKSTD
ncbi:gustatory and pheromone receptor 32a-like [Zeugodacus cucurbitae]|uniref:gustatory and pheromone receptor 32a-like n=1 Tax=Zeugodacus cucurbitae TaxID=28588 RepID=UPI0023D92025|nr:gustatory and pheromone receptor 32a-like [Zeugodacus cucurbitae]